MHIVRRPGRPRRIPAALALIAALVIGLSLAGCGRSEKILIGFSQATMNHPFRVAMVEDNKTYAQQHYKDVELVATDGEDKASKQVADVEALIARRPEVLMLSPATADALTPITKRAMDAGIKVVTLDRQINTPVTAHIGGDNRKIGAMAAQFIAGKLGGKGNIVEIQGTAGSSATVERAQGFQEELKKYPEIRIVATTNADYKRDKAITFMEDTIQRLPAGQINAVFAQNDEMALGAQNALAQANRVQGVTVVGTDGENEGIRAVADGRLAATFTYPWCAPEGIQTAYKIAKGETVPDHTTLPSFQVDSSNVQQFLGKGFG
ncbi:substrate-binding domain-containing protein [Saccharopolyspora hattusasensis]|uniref:substrate-binding domain-containing protein n=1 Tax=Saccharopolyspora hattusasensis TaxID=1128679 RepID=UPI003D97CA3A